MIVSDGIEVGKILGDLSSRFSEFNEALYDFGSKILASRKVDLFIENCNKDNLRLGKRPDGTDIEKTAVGNQKSNRYERRTQYEKNKEGRQYDFVNLYDTGTFYDSIKAVSGADTIYIKSEDPKAIKIEDVWGQILGISQEDLYILIDLLRPDFIGFAQAWFKGENYFIKNV